jgi:outer membrane protein
MKRWVKMPILLTIFIILGQAAPTAAVTLEEAVEYALEHAETIQISRESATALRARGRQRTAFTRPQVDADAGWLELGNNAPENPFFESPEREISAGASASQLLWAGGRIREGRRLEKALGREANLIVAASERDIREAVRMAFDAVLFHRASAAILKDRQEQRRAELADANDLWEVGVVTSLDVRQAKLNLNFASDALTSGQADLEDALIGFNLAIGRPPGADRWLPEGELADVADPDAVIGRLRAARGDGALLDLRERKARAASADSAWEMARGERWPELRAVTSLETSGEEWGETDESWTVGVRAQWNVWDGDLTRARQAEASADLRRAEAELRQTQKELVAEIDGIIVDIRSLAGRIGLQKEAVALSRENYEDARGQYRAGTITLTRLGDFNLNYAEARFNLLRLYFLLREQLTRAEAVLAGAAG